MVEVWRGDVRRVAPPRPRGDLRRRAAAIVAAWGDPDAVILPRSSCKMLQALPLLESGAGDGLDGRAAGARLRLAPAARRCTSSGWRAGSPSSASARPTCAAGRRCPTTRPSATGCARPARRPCQLHNNCSGKHAGFLTLNRRLGGGAGVRRDRPSGAAGGARRLRGDVRRREPRLGHRRLLGAELRHHGARPRPRDGAHGRPARPRAGARGGGAAAGRGDGRAPAARRRRGPGLLRADGGDGRRGRGQDRRRGGLSSRSCPSAASASR